MAKGNTTIGRLRTVSAAGPDSPEAVTIRFHILNLWEHVKEAPPAKKKVRHAEPALPPPPPPEPVDVHIAVEARDGPTWVAAFEAHAVAGRSLELSMNQHDYAPSCPVDWSPLPPATPRVG